MTTRTAVVKIAGAMETYFINIEVHVVPETRGTQLEYPDRLEPLVLGIYSDRDKAEAAAIEYKKALERNLKEDKQPLDSVRILTIEGPFEG